MKWERVTIFISSTFNDMHAERDYLVKDVFPELREWCEERKIHLVDVDLRWGVTEEDSSSNHTVLACLNNIDKSRPFFLCFLGQRRGWVPERGDVSPETLDEYPDVSDAVGRNSVTEMEIEHALLSPMKHIVNGNEKQEIPVRHAVFYFRNPDYLNGLTNDQRKIFTNEAEKDIALADRELIKFKEKIKSGWRYTIDYDCGWDKGVVSPELPENVRQGRLTDFSASGKDLKDIIIEQLKEEIIKEFPNREKVEYTSDLDRDLDQQALFIELNSEGFISREGDFDALNDYVTNDKNGLFVLTAPAGSGKSMLLANYIIKESKKHNVRFLNRFSGVSDLCSQQYSLWKTIFDEARIECPDTLIDLKDKMNGLLKKLAAEKTVIIIDAINQLPDGLDMLEWLPKQLPKKLKIILSLKEDNNDKELSDSLEKLNQKENFSSSTVKLFGDKEEKKKLIKDYLKKYLKALDDKQIDTICHIEGSKNPLYLKVLLSELRIFGSFSQLAQEIQQFGETPKEAFNTVLNRLERDTNSLDIISKEFTPLLFGLLANARNGLLEKEIVSCMQKELSIDKEKLIQAIRLFIRQVRPFMTRREGRIDYFYEAFKLAAGERYSNNKIHYNKRLADYFREQADPQADLTFKGQNIRDFNELSYHLKESENISHLEKILSAYLWIRGKSELSDIQNLINDYSYINVEDENFYHIKLIKDTLVIASHLLKDNIKALPTQLCGRLKDIENVRIKALLTEIENYTYSPWLMPHHHMPSPEEALKVTLIGHIQDVDSVCFSPDGKYIASGSGDWTVRVWDWKKQKEVQILDDLGVFGLREVTSVCFSPDSRYIVFASDTTVYIWEWKKQKEVHKIGAECNRRNSVCLSPDGLYVAIGTYKTIQIWDWENQKEVQRLEGHTGEVSCVCFSPDGKHIISGAEDKTVSVWDWKNQKEVQKLKGHEEEVLCVCMSSDGEYIASGSGDKIIRIWDWRRAKEIQRLEVDREWVTSVCFSPDGKYIIAGSESKIIQVWDWKEQKEVCRLKGHTDRVGYVNFSPDGKYIVSGSDDKAIRIWDWKNQKGTQSSEGHTNRVDSVCFSGNGKYIISGSYDTTVRVWDWKKQKEEHRLEGHTDPVSMICLSPDDRYLASVPMDHTIRIWDWKSVKEIQRLENFTDSITSISFSPDGRHIASGDISRAVRVWDWENQTFEEIGQIEGRTQSNTYVIFSPDGKYVAAGGGHTIHIWGWKERREVKRLKNCNSVGCICFSPDGKYIVSGGSDCTISIWEWEELEEVQRLGGHTSSVYDVCFSSDGKYVASVSKDMTLRIWDWERQDNPQCLMLNTEETLYSCAFSSNNNQVAASGHSGQVLIYDLKNLPAGMPIATALYDLDDHLSVKCRYCDKVFDVFEDKLGSTVKCFHCNEKLKINDFTVNSTIVEDEGSSVKNNDLNIFDEEIKNWSNKIENVAENDIIERNDSIKSEKKKGFFSRFLRDNFYKNMEDFDFEDYTNLFFERYYGRRSDREEIDPKRSYGIVKFYFPDSGREYGRWTGRKNTTDMCDIPLYCEPDGEIFDALQFIPTPFKASKTIEFFKGYLSQEVECEYTAVADGEFYVVSTKNGISFQPYEFRHGEESVMIDIKNQICDFMNEKYPRVPRYQKSLLYCLCFRIYGEWKKGWYNILLDEANGTKAYIRKDEARVCFVDWEEEFRGDRVNFPGHDLYDKPKGNIIEIDDSEKSHYVMLHIEGDWVCVAKEHWSQEQRWLRWRDDNGILPGIVSFRVII